MARVDTDLRDFDSIFSLAGKVAVVTGGVQGARPARGVGAGCAKVFISSRKAAACEAACRLLNGLPGKRPHAVAIALPADLARVGEIERLVDEVGRQTDHVDIVLANAGATWGERFETHPEPAFAKVMDLNVKSVFYTIQKFTPLLKRRATVDEPSRVVVTASVAGLSVSALGEHGTYAYAASKAAVLHLTRNLAVELGPQHVLCNAICPGFFPTKMADGLIALSGGEAALAQSSPNRRLGRPEDFAAAVVYLCSRAGSHVNAADLVLDGGQLWQPKL